MNDISSPTIRLTDSFKNQVEREKHAISEFGKTSDTMDVEKLPQVENDRPSSEEGPDNAMGDANNTTFLDTEGSQPSEAAGPTSRTPDTAAMATYHNPTPPLPEAEKNSYYRSRREGSWGARWRRYWNGDVDPKWADLLLILCFFISGMVDSVAFNVWSCFASMQTGMYSDYLLFLSLFLLVKCRERND